MDWLTSTNVWPKLFSLRGRLNYIVASRTEKSTIWGVLLLVLVVFVLARK